MFVTWNLNNILLRICSQNPDFDLAGNKLVTRYVGRSIIRPLTPPPRSSTPPSLFPAAEAFEDVPQGKVIPLGEGEVAGTAASEAFKDVPQDHGKSMFLY